MRTLPMLLLSAGLLISAQAAALVSPASAKDASQYDGTWTGTTGQGKAIRFVVADGKITEFSAEGSFAGPGCSTTSTVRTNLGLPITGGTATGSTTSGPGGVSFTFRATFTSSASAEGPITMQLHPIPGPPPGVPGHIPSCGGRVDSQWKATKQSATVEQTLSAGGSQESSDSFQSYQGVGLAVLSVERTREFFDFGKSYKAEEGKEYAIVRLRAKFSETAKMIDLQGSELQVFDVDGEAHSFYAGRYRQRSPTASETKIKLPFLVPEGAKLRTLRIGEVSFDLENVKEGMAHSTN